jgi:hypothetical protein
MRVLHFEVSRLRHHTPVRPVLLTSQIGRTHWSDRSDAAAPPSSVLRSWLCGTTKEPSDFQVNHRKPHELCVASVNRHSWLGSHVVLAWPWFWGSTKKLSMTSSCRSFHHAARTWHHWPLGPSNKAYLSSPHLEASPAMTFHACYSPAPTPFKPQPAPAILRQQSVHITWSITNHTRKWPSTGPRTTRGAHPLLITNIHNGHQTTTITTTSHRSREMAVSLSPQETLVTVTKTKTVTVAQHWRRVLCTCVSSI